MILNDILHLASCNDSHYKGTVLLLDFSIETDSQRLAKLQDTFYNWRLKESPEYASKYGNHKYDGQLERYTEEIFQSRMVRALFAICSIIMCLVE